MNRLFSKLFIWIFVAVWLWPNSAAFAQTEEKGDGAGSKSTMDFGLTVGNILPNQIDGMTEITGLGGFHGAYRLNSFSFLEARYLGGNGSGASWQNVAMSGRYEMSVDAFVAAALVGLDVNYYGGNGASKQFTLGGHAGGAILSQIGGSTWLRADMNFQVKPGTSLFIGIGLMFRL